MAMTVPSGGSGLEGEIAAFPWRFQAPSPTRRVSVTCQRHVGRGAVPRLRPDLGRVEQREDRGGAGPRAYDDCLHKRPEGAQAYSLAFNARYSHQKHPKPQRGAGIRFRRSVPYALSGLEVLWVRLPGIEMHPLIHKSPSTRSLLPCAPCGCRRVAPGFNPGRGSQCLR